MSFAFSLAALIALSGSGPAHHPAPSKWLWGVTVDNLDQPEQIRDSLKRLPRRPTVRVVFDETAGPDYYRSSLETLGEAADVMGEPFDSVLTPKVDVQQYRDRMAWYMAELGERVKLWEIGNEVNGDWSGDSGTVAAKVTAGYEEARKRDLPTVLTLFQSEAYKDTDRDMNTWATKYLSPQTRAGIDYVLVSFYPQQEEGEHPDWSQIFADLAKSFPNAQVGFGELGLANADFSLCKDPKRNSTLADRYYRMKPPIPQRYVGGYFWWAFRQEGVPANTPLWETISRAMKAHDR